MLSAIETGQFEVGRLSGLDPDGRPLVKSARTGENDSELAWLSVPLTSSQLTELVGRRERVLLARPQGLPECVILGVLRDRGVPEPAMPRELMLEASEQLVVRCGDARIVLHGDGRFEVHAERISQRARGVHTIKGAAVRIN
jgi:hypothetical protein